MIFVEGGKLDNLEKIFEQGQEPIKTLTHTGLILKSLWQYEYLTNRLALNCTPESDSYNCKDC